MGREGGGGGRRGGKKGRRGIIGKDICMFHGQVVFKQKLKTHSVVSVFVYLFVCLFVCLFICLFVYVFVCLFVERTDDPRP